MKVLAQFALIIGLVVSQPAWAQSGASQGEHGVPELISKLLSRGIPDGADCDDSDEESCPGSYGYLSPKSHIIYHPEKGHELYMVMRSSDVFGDYYFEQEKFVPDAVEMHKMFVTYCSQGAPVYDDPDDNKFRRYTIRYNASGIPIGAELFLRHFTHQNCGPDNSWTETLPLSLQNEEVQKIIREESQFWKEWDASVRQVKKRPQGLKNGMERLPIKSHSQKFRTLYPKSKK